MKFSGVSWKGNEGFFYSSYDKPKGSELSAKTQEHKLFYHKLNTPQSEDELIFGGSETPRRYIGGYVSDDEKILIYFSSESTSGNELYVKDLSDWSNPIVPIAEGFDSEHSVLDNDGDRLLIVTNLDAP